MNWYLTETDIVLRELQSSQQHGLSSAEAQTRLIKYGHNELIERRGRTPFQILWEQLTATMVLILIAAAAVAAFLGDSKNAMAIMAIVVVCAILGFIQEYRAEKAIAALKRMSVPTVRVIHDGVLKEISARDLVPGDILQLEAGNVVPADARLLEAVNLRIQEAALTGESEPIEKQTAALSSDDLPLGDRRNMAYMSTVVTQGRALAVITATGMRTELGRIADLLQQTGSAPTPLQRRLDQVGKTLAMVGVAIATLIFILGL
jgi:Ca2+-transporting ATPase